MTPSNLSRRHLQVLPLYRYFSLCDWLVEPGVDQTNDLLRLADNDVVASDEQHVVVRVPTDNRVAVRFETWAGDPGEPARADGWAEHREVTLHCPSAEIYLDQPTAVAIDLRDALPAGPGTYSVRVAWQRALPGNETSPGGEQYLVQTWRRGDLPAAVAARYADDDDE